MMFMDGCTMNETSQNGLGLKNDILNSKETIQLTPVTV